MSFNPTANLNGVLSGPLSSSRLVSGTVCLVDMRDLRNEWVIWVRICEHGADGEKDCLFVSKHSDKGKIRGIPLDMVRAGDH